MRLHLTIIRQLVIRNCLFALPMCEFCNFTIKLFFSRLTNSNKLKILNREFLHLAICLSNLYRNAKHGTIPQSEKYRLAL